jgi:predicted Zn-dependent peptidase
MVEFRTAELANGLRVIAEVDPDALSSAAGFFVRTGARDEAHEVMGVSHFLEHMMFKGTDAISADDLNRRFDEMGARNNAYTSGDMTVFYASVLPERLDEADELLARMMRPALREDDFTTEKGVILEEIAMYKDNPFWVLYETCMERHYRGHPLGHRVLGTKETITNLESAQMREYFEHRYSADNTTVALAGNLNFDRCVDQIGRLCAEWERTGATREPGAPPVGAGAFEMREDVGRAYMLGVSTGPPVEDDRRYAASLGAQVLGAHDNSRLHWALIETGLADEAQAEFHARDGIGEYLIYASGDPAKADEIWAAVEKEIASLVDSIAEEDLEKLRARMLTSVTLGGERPGDRMQRIGRVWTQTGQYRTLEDELDRISRVSVDEVKQVLTDMPLEPQTIGSMLPGNGAA